eukprot:TRINITY_DN385_c0_g2_i2.p1 TRINITY_DN385_c0_g2~~TRINITY_DN385_c0_g2_i2.p1  ORF type:complete len:655 (+),score=222.98 TRINITY_DN385_c0_g2_i2:99-2063(+)
MLFDFYVTLAVRATGSELVPVAECEMTELSWAALDAETGDVVDQHTLAIAPRFAVTRCPSGAVSFEEALASLDAYIEDSFTSRDLSFAFVTDGPFPLRRAVKLEAAAKGVHLAHYWSNYYDIRKEAMRTRPDAAATLTSLARVAEAFGVAAPPADCGAAAESAAVGEVLGKLLAEGAPLSQRPQLIPSGELAALERQWHAAPVSRDRIQHQQQQAQQASGFADEVSGQRVCVRMRGLPFQATPADVRRFFQGLEIAEPDGIQFLYNLQGKSKGEAFVRFASEEQAAAGAKRDKQFMGERYIEVFTASLQDMRYCLAQSNPSTAGSTIVRCRGMPYSTAVEDVAEFFDGCKIVKSGISVCVGSQGRPTGEAFVQFATEDDTSRALRRHRCHLGGRYVEIFRSSQQEMVSQYQQRLRPLGYKRGADRPTSPSQFSPHVVRLRGLPFSLNEMDVASLFAGLRVCRHGIHMVYSAEEKPTGEAFVEFETSGDAERAVAKHKTPIGHRYVEVFHSAPEEIVLAAGGCDHDPAPLPIHDQPPLPLDQGLMQPVSTDPDSRRADGVTVRRIIIRSQPLQQQVVSTATGGPVPPQQYPQPQQHIRVLNLAPQGGVYWPAAGDMPAVAAGQQTVLLSQQQTIDCTAAPMPMLVPQYSVQQYWQ